MPASVSRLPSRDKTRICVSPARFFKSASVTGTDVQVKLTSITVAKKSFPGVFGKYRSQPKGTS